VKTFHQSRWAIEYTGRRLILAGRGSALAGIGVYRLMISPILTASMGPACRFAPTCSEYASAAIARHGAIRGGWLALKRLSRCRPGGGWGYDPVAEREIN
jgi:putative membrane protein insertion efficiency factor